MNLLLQILISALAAFVAVNWAYFRVLKIAKLKQIVDNPNARKLQKKPIPILGGVAVFFGVVVGVLTGASLFWMIEGSPLYRLAPVTCAMILMIYAGAMDDVLGLTAKNRFIIEILTVLGLIFAGAGCIDSLHGLWGIESFSWWIAVPLTVFAGVGIINAVNMIDGVNGLSSGLCILCSVLFGVAFLKVDDQPNAILAFTMAAALLPFLFHNVFGNKSRMFIGDAGTMMMGVLMTWFTICVLRSDSSLKLLAAQKNVNMVAMSLAILSVPIFDTVRVMVQRMVKGKSPFSPDKTHLHHVFIRMGVSHSITALIEITLDAAIVLIWAASVKLKANLDWQLYFVLISAMVLVWGMYFFIRRQEDRHTSFMHHLARISIKSHLGHSNWWLRLQKWLDAPEKKYNVGEDDVETPANTLYDFYHFDEIDPDNVVELDRKKVFDFLKGKAEVFVDDIKQRSGADPERVDALVREGIEDGFISVIKKGARSTPSIVALKEEM